MPLDDEGLTAQFTSRQAAVSQLAALGWVDQGGPKRRKFLPHASRLWSAEFEPAFDSCEPVKLYVLMALDQAGAVAKVQTVVARVLRNGRRDEMYLPVCYADDEAAKELLLAALTPEAREALAAEKAQDAALSLCLPGLARLVGRPATCPEAQLLAARFRLRSSQTLFSEGQSWTAMGSRLEFQANPGGDITVMHWTTTSLDRLQQDVPATSTREQVRALWGTPTKSADDNSWDRFDHRLALHVTYARDGGAVTKVTLMDRRVAP